jgi:hypothetical protein
MTQSERLRAIVSHAERHCISSDVLFAVLVALEDAFFIQDDADEYNNDEAIAAFKALEAEIKHPKPTLTDEEREAILTAADLLIGSKPGATLRWLLVRLRSTP